MPDENVEQPAAIELSADVAAVRLNPFFEMNNYSTIDLIDLGGKDRLAISKPWGDSSLTLALDEDFDELSAVLNQIILPERLSAIWHKDTRKLEVIWTAYNLPDTQKEIVGRKFKFEFRRKKHQCEFGKSSERLLVLAKAVKPLTISETTHRNMLSYGAYIRTKVSAKPNNMYDEPLSFWISNVSWKEHDVIELVKNISFYLTYYDYMCPTIVVHPTLADSGPSHKRTRYRKGKFPSTLSSDVIDENLLSFWNFAETGNPMLRFLLYYRILEYGAVHFIDHTIRTNLKKQLSSPDLRSDLDGAIEAIIAEVSASKLSDAQRLQAVVKHSVDPAMLFGDIKANIAFFSKDTVFDGGFAIKAIVGANDTEGTFRARGLEAFADAVRKIRNALSHGKDQETAGVIRPTPQNFKLFQPWVHLIAVAAGEVVLYREAT